MASEQAIALYRKLNSSGTAITNSNWREWERMASSAMKMQDFTPRGQSESLHDLANEVGIEIQALKSRASRPGEKATFKVEDRFYFGKGRKERFTKRQDIVVKIRAWIDSRGLDIGAQETDALSYIAANHVLRGGVSIEQAVKSAARRHVQVGLASAGLREWIEENR